MQQETWSKEGFEMYLAMHRRDYEQGCAATKEFVLKCLNELFDDIMNGKIVVKAVDKLV